MPLCCSPCSAGNESTGDREKSRQDQIKYQVLDQEYKRFSKTAGLRLQHERMEMTGFGPKQAWAAERMFAEQESAAADAVKYFGVESKDDSKFAIKHSTMKTKGGFACFPDGDALNKNIKQVTPLEDYFDVAMHGSPTAVGFGSEKRICQREHLRRLFDTVVVITGRKYGFFRVAQEELLATITALPKISRMRSA